MRFYLFLLFIFSFSISDCQKIAIKDTIYITKCDTSNIGKMVFDLDEIKKSIDVNSSSISPTVYVCVASGGVSKIINILSNPQVVDICQNLGQGWTDIAMNKDKQIYLCTKDAIYKLDTTNCTLTLFYQFTGTFIVALSFDTKNNLYYSNGTAIYRFNNTAGAPVLWYDFGVGTASGDFVMKNGKMFISWVVNSKVRLYEVTVDNNINYISSTYQCIIKASSFGLASELGVLYGVTPSELYSIDDATCTYTTIKINSGLNWYGAAGLHEAQNSISIHPNYSDAISFNNPLFGKWTNITPYNQVIYVAVDDKIKDSIIIYPVKIKIIPKTIQTVNKTICKGDNYYSYTSAGTYTDKFKDQYGCDSTRILNLKIVDKYIDTFKATICQGNSFRSYSTAGTYIENFKSINGCDSQLVLLVNVNQPSAFTLPKTICESKIFLGHTTSGTYTHIYKNSKGCDSTLTLILSVVKVNKPWIDIYGCINPGKPLPFFNQIIRSPGVYIDSTNYLEQCDSVFRIHVSLVVPKRDTAKSIQCQGYVFKGFSLQNDTAIWDTVFSQLGCDSVYTLRIFKIQKFNTPNPRQVYYCDTFNWGNNTYIKDTILYQTLKYSTAPFCDSIKQKYLFIKSPKPTISIFSPNNAYCIKGETISIEAKGGLKYLWNTLETNSKINIKPFYSQTYIVKGWNQYNCLDSAMINIEVEDPVIVDLPQAFSPNGDNLNEFWKPNSTGNYDLLILDVYNRWGEKVFAGNHSNQSWDGNYKGVRQPAGLYSYILSVRKNRIIYEKYGSVILVR